MQPHLDQANNYIIRAVQAFVAGREIPLPEPGVDWFDRAGLQGVQSIIEAGLRRTGVGAVPGVDLKDRMATHFTVAAQHELGLTELAHVATWLGAAAVDWVVFKGPVLSHDVYRDPDARWFTDLDLLVAPAAFGRAIDALVAQGAELLDQNWAHSRDARVSELSLLMPHGTLIDLHWHLIGRPRQRRRFRFDTDEILARARQVELRPGLTVPTLDELDTVIHLAAHGCTSGGHLVRWLTDLSMAMRAYCPDPGLLRSRARSQHAAAATQIMLDRAARYVDPDLASYRGSVAGPSLLTPVADAWSERFPPGQGLQGRRSGRALYHAVGGTGLQTLWELPWEVRTAIIERHRTRAFEAAHPGAVLRDQTGRETVGGPDERSRYLGEVSAQAW